jgi:hypothetical protein
MKPQSKAGGEIHESRRQNPRIDPQVAPDQSCPLGWCCEIGTEGVGMPLHNTCRDVQARLVFGTSSTEGDLFGQIVETEVRHQLGLEKFPRWQP